MGGGGSKGTNTIERQNTEPWYAAKPYYQSLYERAGTLANSAPAQPQMRYVAPTPATRSALQDIESLNGIGWDRLEQGNTALRNASQTFQGLSGQARNPYESNFSNMAQAEYSPQYSNMSGLADQGRALSDTYAGKYLSPDSNPYLRQYFQQASEDIGRAYRDQTVPGLMSTFRSPDSSMYSLYQGEANRGFSDALQRAATGIYGGAYESERQRQMAAAQQLADIYQGAEGMYANTQARKAGLYGQAAGLYQQGFENQANIARQQASLSPLFAAQAQAEAQRRLMGIQAGEQLRGEATREAQMNDPAYAEQAQYAQDWDTLQKLSNIISGGGQSSVAIQNSPSSGSSVGSTMLGAAGGAATAAGLYSGLTGAGILSGPYGWAALAGGALLGGLGSRL